MVMSKEQMTTEQIAELVDAYRRWNAIIVRLWRQDIQGHIYISRIFEVEAQYPCCILATYHVKRKLEQMNIPVRAVYFGEKSRVVLIEIMADKEKAEELNRNIKEEIPVSGWLIVEHEYQEDGTEEQRSQVKSA